MSGVEVAGLVLGAIPLILAGLEFYANGIAITKRYWRYREEFKSLIIELRTEHTMCVNSIQMLLTGVVRKQDMAEFLACPCGDEWKEAKFEKKLKERLGSTYESYIDTIGQMNHTAENFKQRLKLGESGKPQFDHEKTFKEQYRRLKFSLNKSDYNDLMAKLSRANSALHRMTTQTISLNSLQRSYQTDRQTMPNFRIINQYAQGFHAALCSGWKCSCHADHSVNLRLEPRMEDVASDDEDDSMRGPFHVLFRNGQHAPEQALNTNDVASWSWEEADVRITHSKRTKEASSLPQKSECKGGKGVRFANQAKKAVQAALDANPNLRPIQDLCSAISTLRLPQRDVCFELLATELAMQKYGIHIYPEKTPPCNPEAWSVSSLRAVLQDENFTRHDRLRVAVTLASSVLQLHETPWLEENWSKDNIFFVRRSDQTVYSQPFVSQSFDLVGNTSSASSPSVMTRIIRNQTLYALGISLIELWYGKPLHELQSMEDGPPTTGYPQIDLMTQWNACDRLVEALYSEAGAKYTDAVRRCIRCDFDRRASSLEDSAFQKAVYHGVVSELKDNLDFLYRD